MKLAVVGNPISHSKSPLIFQYLFDVLKLDFSYEKVILNSADEILSLFENGISGINITAPFKQSSIPFLDEQSEEVKQIGSVNTIVSKGKRLIGHNTDYLGVLNALEENGVRLDSKTILILGAGGAARAAIYGLKKRNTKILLYNRTVEKARLLAKEFAIDFLQEDDLKRAVNIADIVIDTLPQDIRVLKSEGLHKKLTILDASYPNSIYDESKVEKLIGGEHWLLHQAIPAFELFTGIKLNKGDYNQKALLNLLMKTK